MAVAPRRSTDVVSHAAEDAGMNALERLRAEPYRYTLFAALRAIERAYASQPRLGEARRAAQEPVRLAQTPHLSFAPADVAGFGMNAAGRPLLETYSFGMFGPNGALPLHLTEMAYDRRRQLSDPSVNDFVNFFQHRLIALFYRAWADADPATCHDRPDTDRFRLYLGALLGMGTEHSRSRDAVSDYAKLSRAAQFAGQSRSPQGLESVLADYFDLPVRVKNFVGAWLDIPREARSRLGYKLGDREDSAVLGVGASLGSASWQSQHKFEIAVGPVDFETFRNFLPGADGLKELASLVRLYTNDEWSWQLRLLLKGAERPAPRLGGGMRLGWSTWMSGDAAMADEVVIQGDLCDAMN